MTFVNAAVIVGSAAVGAYAQKRASERAADAAIEGSEASIDFARESRDIADAYQRPYREAGYTALDALMGLTGLQSPASVRGAAAGGVSPGAVGRASKWGELGFDPDKPMTADEIRRAYRLVWGREADPGGLQYHLTQSPKRGGSEGIAPFGWAGGGDVLGLGPKEGKRGAFTFNEFYAAAQGLPDYQEGIASGRLKPVDLTPGAVRAEETAAAPRGAQPTPRELLEADPGYQFRLEEGMRALEAGASARGGFGDPHSRRTLRFAQGLASQEYQNVYNRISNIAGLGQVGAGYSTQAALQYGQQAGQAAQSGALTRGSAYLAQGNQIANLLGQGVQAWAYTRRPPTGGNYQPQSTARDYQGYGINRGITG